MPVETLTGVPCDFAAGTTVRFTLSYADYPASAWSLSFHLLGSANLSVNADASGDDFLVTLTASQTASLTPGQYRWSAKVQETATGDVAIAADGYVRVKPDLSNSTVGPWRTRYNAAVAALSGVSTGKYQSVSVEGQSFTMRSVAELQTMVHWLQSEALKEDARLGRATSGGLKRIQYRI